MGTGGKVCAWDAPRERRNPESVSPNEGIVGEGINRQRRPTCAPGHSFTTVIQQL